MLCIVKIIDMSLLYKSHFTIQRFERGCQLRGLHIQTCVISQFKLKIKLNKSALRVPQFLITQPDCAQCWLRIHNRPKWISALPLWLFQHVSWVYLLTWNFPMTGQLWGRVGRSLTVNVFCSLIFCRELSNDQEIPECEESQIFPSVTLQSLSHHTHQCCTIAARYKEVWAHCQVYHVSSCPYPFKTSTSQRNWWDLDSFQYRPVPENKCLFHSLNYIKLHFCRTWSLLVFCILVNFIVSLHLMCFTSLQ